MKNIILLVIMTVFLLSMVDSKKEEPVDIWYRTVPDVDSEGQTTIYKLDMQVGYAYSDEYYIYLIVKKYDVDELVVIAIRNGDYWSNDASYWVTPKDLKEEIEMKILENQYKDSGKIESIK